MLLYRIAVLNRADGVVLLRRYSYVSVNKMAMGYWSGRTRSASILASLQIILRGSLQVFLLTRVFVVAGNSTDVYVPYIIAA